MKVTPEGEALIKEYGCLFTNTGGNDIKELIERKGLTYDTNPVTCELQGCCTSQLLLLTVLARKHLLR